MTRVFPSLQQHCFNITSILSRVSKPPKNCKIPRTASPLTLSDLRRNPWRTKTATRRVLIMSRRTEKALITGLTANRAHAYMRPNVSFTLVYILVPSSVPASSLNFLLLILFPARAKEMRGPLIFRAPAYRTVERKWICLTNCIMFIINITVNLVSGQDCVLSWHYCNVRRLLSNHSM